MLGLLCCVRCLCYRCIASLSVQKFLPSCCRSLTLCRTRLDELGYRCERPLKSLDLYARALLEDFEPMLASELAEMERGGRTRRVEMNAKIRMMRSAGRCFGHPEIDMYFEVKMLAARPSFMLDLFHSHSSPAIMLAQPQRRGLNQDEAHHVPHGPTLLHTTATISSLMHPQSS